MRTVERLVILANKTKKEKEKMGGGAGAEGRGDGARVCQCSRLGG